MSKPAVLSCSIHGELTAAVCEPCELRRIAERILDRRLPDVPIPGRHKALLAQYALKALDAQERAG